MISRTTGRRVLAASVAGAAALLCLPIASASAHRGPDHQPAHPAPKPVALQILSFNDFHGYLEPPTGADGTLATAGGSVTAGGVEYLTTELRALRQGHKNTLTVAAGDLIGGSPFLSGLFKDEPSVEVLNQLKLDVSSVGNHEFDEGVPELLRMRYGGCNPDQGCFDSDGYSGTKFDYLAANVQYKDGVSVTAPKGTKAYGSWFRQSTGRTVLPPTSIKTVQGIKVGFIGMTLEGTPELVAQAGIKNVSFKDEVVTANLAAKDLRHQGVQAIVVLLHEGGLPTSGATYDYDCNTGSSAAISGPIVQIAKGLDPSIDMLVTGHTHQAYTCDIPDPAGHARWVTSAASFGRVVTETELKLDPKTKDVIRASVQPVNHAVLRTVTPAADQTAVIAKWKALSAPIANRAVGSITADINHSVTRDAESGLGDLIADAQLAATSDAAAGGAKMAFMNPGGVRAALTYTGSAAGEADGNVTYGEAFTVQPFGNLLVSLTVTGAQIHTMLEQQWTTQTDGSVKFLHLGVSKGFTYTRSLSAPVGSKVDPASITLAGVPIDPAASYRVTVNSFLADGGDGFTVLTQGTDRVGGGVDLDAFTNYLTANSPVTGPAPTRVAIRP
jgi:5'-nucleotidase